MPHCSVCGQEGKSLRYVVYNKGSGSGVLCMVHQDCVSAVNKGVFKDGLTRDVIVQGTTEQLVEPYNGSSSSSNSSMKTDESLEELLDMKLAAHKKSLAELERTTKTIVENLNRISLQIPKDVYGAIEEQNKVIEALQQTQLNGFQTAISGELLNLKSDVGVVKTNVETMMDEQHDTLMPLKKELVGEMQTMSDKILSATTSQQLQQPKPQRSSQMRALADTMVDVSKSESRSTKSTKSSSPSLNNSAGVHGFLSG